MTTNVWDPTTHPKHHQATELLLTGQTLSAQDLRDACGGLSPRTLGAVLRAIEDQEATVLRQQDPEWGVLYQFAPSVEFRPEFRVSRTSGHDAERWYEPTEEEEPPPVYRRGEGPEE